MDLVKRNSTKTFTLTLGSDPDSNSVNIVLIHTWGGDVVTASTAATRISTGVYQYAVDADETDSCGVHKITWSYAVSTVAKNKTTYFEVYEPYTTLAKFFTNHPELEEDFSDTFDVYEQSVRNVINNYCGQDFCWYPSKTLVFDGNNNRSIHTNMRIDSIESVTLDKDETTETVLDSSLYELSPGSKHHIRYKSTTTKFKPENTITVVGNWGWGYVPSNVSQAADLLVASWMNEDHEARRHGLVDQYMDTVRLRYREDVHDTTGNTDSDILLMDYQLIVFDYIV